MPAKWPWNLPERSGGDYVKRLEGIHVTPKLTALIQARLKETKNQVSSTTDSFFTMPTEDARAMLLEHINQQKSPTAISLSVVRALYSLSHTTREQNELNEALGGASTKLTFTPPPPVREETTSDKKFKKRMDRLRLRAEEAKYQKLTDSLGHVKQDDVTVRSMTYAASVGLNMIIAPISFGVFMYFFAGQIFSWLAPNTNEEMPLKTIHHDGAVDIKRVIAGVVSGVMMLFIEMILFVIRTHAMEESMRKKNNKKTVSPFGYTKPKAATEAGSRVISK